MPCPTVALRAACGARRRTNGRRAGKSNRRTTSLLAKTAFCHLFRQRVALAPSPPPLPPRRAGEQKPACMSRRRSPAKVAFSSLATRRGLQLWELLATPAQPRRAHCTRDCRPAETSREVVANRRHLSGCQVFEVGTDQLMVGLLESGLEPALVFSGQVVTDRHQPAS